MPLSGGPMFNEPKVDDVIIPPLQIEKNLESLQEPAPPVIEKEEVKIEEPKAEIKQETIENKKEVQSEKAKVIVLNQKRNRVHIEPEGLVSKKVYQG